MRTYDGFSKSGFCYNTALALTASYTYNEMGFKTQGDGSQGLEFDASLRRLLIELSAMATDGTGPTSALFYFSRDSLGTQPISPIYPATIYKADGALSATGCISVNFVDLDYHTTDRSADVGVGESIYLCIKFDQGTATADRAHLSWAAK